MQTLRILIAGHRLGVSARLTAQLQGLGHQVVGMAEDGRQAVASAADLQPDLVVLDLRLPLLNSIEVARGIMGGNPVPIILVCPYASAHLVRRAEEAGIMTCLTRSAGSRELRAGIKGALARFAELQAVWQQRGSLEQALQSRLLVEEAKRVLMRWLNLSKAEAFRRLDRDSRASRTSLKEVASVIIGADELLFRKPRLARTLRVILSAVRQESAAMAGKAV